MEKSHNVKLRLWQAPSEHENKDCLVCHQSQEPADILGWQDNKETAWQN